MLNQYQNLLNVFSRGIGEHRFDYRERTDLHQALAQLTVEIRRDLIGDLDLKSHFSGREIERRVMENNAMTSRTYDHYHPSMKDENSTGTFRCPNPCKASSLKQPAEQNPFPSAIHG